MGVGKEGPQLVEKNPQPPGVILRLEEEVGKGINIVIVLFFAAVNRNLDMEKKIDKNPFDYVSFVSSFRIYKSSFRITKPKQKEKGIIFFRYVLLVMGERRELNPRVVDSQSTALIHLATSAP